MSETKIPTAATTDVSSIIAEVKALLPKVTGGDWHAGHLSDDSHPCNCRGVVNEGYAGAICHVQVGNGLPIGEGGNDSPPIDEAKANLLWIALLNPVTVTVLMDRIKELECLLDVQKAGHRETARQSTANLIRATTTESTLAKARAEALEEAAKVVDRFIPICFDGTIAGRSIKDEKQALLRDVAQAVRKGGANG